MESDKEYFARHLENQQSSNDGGAAKQQGKRKKLQQDTSSSDEKRDYTRQFSVHIRDRRQLDELADYLGLSKAGTINLALRELAAKHLEE